jgi:hypothetical protein
MQYTPYQVFKQLAEDKTLEPVASNQASKNASLYGAYLEKLDAKHESTNPVLQRALSAVVAEAKDLNDCKQFTDESVKLWAEQFASATAMSDSLQKYETLVRLNTDFLSICQTYGEPS